MTSIIFATTVLLLCSVVVRVLAFNRAFCEQHCVHKATHPVQVSFLVFVFSNIFHINSFCSQNVTEQFTVINLWPLLHLLNLPQSKLHVEYCLDWCLFHLNSTSGNILPLSADISVVVKTSPAL